MRKVLKKIDAYLSSKIVGNTIGLYPNLLGQKGRLKLRLSRNTNARTILRRGVVDLDEVLNNEVTVFLRRVLDELEIQRAKVNVSATGSFVSKSLKVFTNPATLKITNGELLLNAVNPGTDQLIKTKIEDYFSISVDICSVLIWRNFSTEDATLFSGDWHFDRRPTHWFRLFVLLEDVGASQGPFMYFQKKNSKQFTRDGFQRLDKSWQAKLKSLERAGLTREFVGKEGLGIVVDTQNLLHRAGVAEPGHSRDMLEVVFKIA